MSGISRIYFVKCCKMYQTGDRILFCRGVTRVSGARGKTKICAPKVKNFAIFLCVVFFFWLWRQPQNIYCIFFSIWRPPNRGTRGMPPPPSYATAFLFKMNQCFDYPRYIKVARFISDRLFLDIFSAIYMHCI